MNFKFSEQYLSARKNYSSKSICLDSGYPFLWLLLIKRALSVYYSSGLFTPLFTKLYVGAEGEHC